MKKVLVINWPNMNANIQFIGMIPFKTLAKNPAALHTHNRSTYKFRHKSYIAPIMELMDICLLKKTKKSLKRIPFEAL